MKKLAFLTAVLLPLLAHAGEQKCPLITPDDLLPLHFTAIGDPARNSVEVPKDQVGGPSDMQVNICFYYAGKPGSRNTFNITVETYLDMAGVPQWLESVNAAAGKDGGEVTRIGAATCEAGNYFMDKPKPGEKPENYQQHYVTCDTLAGERRISVGFEQAASAEGLPSVAEVNSLLTLAVARAAVLAKP